MRTRLLSPLIAVAGLCASATAHADLRVGVSLSMTGPAASAGISQQKAVALLPTKVGSENVMYVVLDDATDPTRAAQNARKLVTEDRVDVLIGSTATPGAIAMTQVAAESRTPIVTVAPVDVTADTQPWTFMMVQSTAMMVDAVVDDMKRKKVRTVAFLGYSDSFGEGWIKGLNALAPQAGMSVVAAERFARTDTSVLSQVLKIVAANPDAVLVGASTTVAALPQRTLRERGYKGLVYHTHGTATAEFLKAVGADGKDALVPAGGVIAAEQLAAGVPNRVQAQEYVQAYEAANGAQSRTVFSANLWDAARLVTAAAAGAMASAKPGTPEFRAALRDRMEQMKGLPLANGVLNNTRENHNGFDKSSVVLIRVVDGRWVIEKP